jgi:hypothetical protein
MSAKSLYQKARSEMALPFNVSSGNLRLTRQPLGVDS